MGIYKCQLFSAGYSVSEPECLTMELCGGYQPSAQMKCYARFSLPFQYSGSLLSCITATINTSSSVAWYITPYGKRFVKHLLVFTDSGAHASGNERMFCIVR